jgi:hypothetical protein
MKDTATNKPKANKATKKTWSESIRTKDDGTVMTWREYSIRIVATVFIFILSAALLIYIIGRLSA